MRNGGRGEDEGEEEMEMRKNASDVTISTKNAIFPHLRDRLKQSNLYRHMKNKLTMFDSNEHISQVSSSPAMTFNIRWRKSRREARKNDEILLNVQNR